MYTQTTQLVPGIGIHAALRLPRLLRLYHGNRWFNAINEYWSRSNMLQLLRMTGILVIVFQIGTCSYWAIAQAQG